MTIQYKKKRYICHTKKKTLKNTCKVISLNTVNKNTNLHSTEKFKPVRKGFIARICGVKKDNFSLNIAHQCTSFSCCKSTVNKTESQKHQDKIINCI